MGLFKRLKQKREEKKERRENGNSQIMLLTYLFMFIFVALIAYILVFTYKDSSDVINNSYNTRESLFLDKVYRGSILSRDGDVLAYSDYSSKEYGENGKRVYPYANMFAHVVGYNEKGKMGIENSFNYKMLESDMFIAERITNDFNGNKNLGNNVVSTLDLNAQKAAYDALSNNRGAVIAMDAETGDILVMVSKPDFDPNFISQNWNTINGDTSSTVLLNRAIQGVYPPGSTFKIVTALDYIRENPNYNSYDFGCEGSFSYEGSLINCYHGIKHGDVDFKTSFAKSCNSSFANITTKLNRASFQQTCKDVLFNTQLPCPISGVKKSFVPINENSSIDELLQTGIGQGETLVTPYHMCLIAAAIANDGILIEPRIVKEIQTANGDIVKRYKIKEYGRIISAEDASLLTELMREVVLTGTATKLNNTNNYEAYGKTGSAEFSSDKSASHAWFTGFANYSGKKVAITVIIENGGSGGEKAAPVARDVFDALGEK